MIFKLAEWGAAPVSLFFIFIFLPLSLFAHYAVSAKYRVHSLLIISFAFLAMVAPWQIPIILASTLSSNLLSNQISRLSENAKWQRRFLLAICVAINIGIWVTFGILSSYREMPYLLGSAVFPLLAMDTVFRVYYSKEHRIIPFFKYLLYMIFFPRIYLGPFGSIESFLKQDITQKPAGKNLLRGAEIFVRGGFQFSFLGMRLIQLCQQIEGFTSSEITWLSAWSLTLILGLGIYNSLAGFSGISQGLGVMYGVMLPPITEKPFLALGISDFYAKLHPTLRRFFLTTVYRPLSRYSKDLVYRGALVIIIGALTGLWFEFSLNMLLWGAFIGAFIVFERFILGNRFKGGTVFAKRSYTLVVLILSFSLMALGRSSWDITLVKALVFSKTVTPGNNEIAYLLSSNSVVIGLGLLLATDIPLGLSRWCNANMPKVSRGASVLFHAGLFIVLTALIV